MPRKQLNVTLTPEQYAAVREAAAQEGVKVSAYCRNAVLAQAMPEPGRRSPTWPRCRHG